VTDRHKQNPVPFRPTPDNRAWLQAQRQAGRAVNAILNAALDAYRKLTPKEDQP